MGKNQIEAHLFNSDRRPTWEYCTLRRDSKRVGKQEYVLFVDERGAKTEVAVQSWEHTISLLGSAGWEMCGVHHERYFTGSRNKIAANQGLLDFGRDAAMLTGEVEKSILFFKRRSYGVPGQAVTFEQLDGHESSGKTNSENKSAALSDPMASFASSMKQELGRQEINSGKQSDGLNQAGPAIKYARTLKDTVVRKEADAQSEVLEKVKGFDRFVVLEQVTWAPRPKWILVKNEVSETIGYIDGFHVTPILETD